MGQVRSPGAPHGPVVPGSSGYRRSNTRIRMISRRERLREVTKPRRRVPEGGPGVPRNPNSVRLEATRSARPKTPPRRQAPQNNQERNPQEQPRQWQPDPAPPEQRGKESAHRQNGERDRPAPDLRGGAARAHSATTIGASVVEPARRRAACRRLSAIETLKTIEPTAAKFTSFSRVFLARPTTTPQMHATTTIRRDTRRAGFAATTVAALE